MAATVELVLPQVRNIEEMKLTELIARASWREAVTYRDTWPHEYVLSEKDGQRELLDAIYARFQDGEGVDCRFFRVRNKYLFIGDFKYWFNSQWDGFDPNGENVINRARLYRDRRDCHSDRRHREAGGLTVGTSSFRPATPGSRRTTQPIRPSITKRLPLTEIHHDSRSHLAQFRRATPYPRA